METILYLYTADLCRNERPGMSAVHIRTPFTSLTFIVLPAPSPYITFVYTSVSSSALDFVPAPRAELMAGSEAAVDVRDTFGMLVIGTILGSMCVIYLTWIETIKLNSKFLYIGFACSRFYGITLLQTGLSNMILTASLYDQWSHLRLLCRYLFRKTQPGAHPHFSLGTSFRSITRSIGYADSVPNHLQTSGECF